MLKTTIYGLPMNPMPLLEDLQGRSFCVSYATRQKLGKQLDQAIELVGEDQILLVDNGAFSHWKTGGAMTEDYVDGFIDWASDILDRCDQAIVVLPDVIGGSMEENHRLVIETMTAFPEGRVMPIWHMHEPVTYLLYLCESFSYVGFGSTVDAPGSEKWHARIREAFAAIDVWEAESNGAYIRPRLHMMRAQAFAHLYPFDSADSTNVAMNHNRQLKKSGENVKAFAARVDARIQASAGPEAEHQIKRPLLDHIEIAAFNQRMWEDRMMELNRSMLHASLTEERVLDAVERGHVSLDSPGFCVTCGSEAHNCEPDAREYTCEACGKPHVFGAEEIMFQTGMAA
jgi:hypothetical protein